METSFDRYRVLTVTYIYKNKSINLPLHQRIVTNMSNQ